MKKIEGYINWPEKLVNKYKENGIWEGITFGNMLEKQAELYPDNIAIIDKSDNTKVTYSEFNDITNKIAQGLNEKNIFKGDKVVIQLPNIKEFFFITFALFKMGGIPVFSLPSHREREIQHLVHSSNAKGYVIKDNFQGFDYKNLANVVKSEVENIFVLGLEKEFCNFNELYSCSNINYKSPSSEDLAFLQLSGGTTGLPKLIPRIHDDYFYSIRRSNEICGLSEETVYLTSLPVAHNFPMSSPGTFGVILAGGRIVLNLNGSPDETFKIIEEEKITFTSLVPSLMIVWNHARKSKILDYNLESLKCIQVGGSKFKPSLVKESMKHFDCQFQQVFGMAEGLVNYTYLNDTNEKIINTQGKPMSEYDVIKIVDEEGNEVSQGEIGSLIVQGPYTIRGYYNAPKYNQKSFTDSGYYRTGDLVYQDKEGYLIVEGRDKDVINRGGENVSAEEIEDILLRHEDIFDVAIVAKSDDFMGEKICAFVVSDKETAQLEIREFLIDSGLAGYKVPEIIKSITTLPKTGIGKINKKELRNLLEKGEY